MYDPELPRNRNPRIPKDLETIVLKCLRKDPADRYGTAEALGQDLRRFVRGDPVEARPEGRWGRVRRRIVRNRRRIVTVTLVLISLLACGGLAYRLFLDKKEEGRCEEVVAVKEVNSPFVESSPTYSADGLELYFGSKRPGEADSDIWVVRRSDSRDAWGQPLNVKELNSSSHEAPAWLSPNGLRLYYVTVMETPEGRRSSIRIATRDMVDPSVPWKPVPDETLTEINKLDFFGHPCLTSDELELYFAADLPGGAGRYDIWVATRLNRRSPWGTPRNLDEMTK